MKRIFGLFLVLLATGCEKQSTNRNPYLQELGFYFELNMNLPLYSALTNPGSTVYIASEQVGTRGVFVTNTGFDVFRVFEASCPNHAPNECSTMEDNSQVATCACENYKYSLITGQMLNRPNDGKRYYDMLEYRARVSGNSVLISN